ncbi:helix-turn-helix domain-containing protein [Streptomyces sp. NPDC057307]|uniref:helix-turn-helix domain-containing protein n=1 Tax=Streptomyces sp. NPDC057307 TaxID=3346096 RepID=UPI00362EE756
MAGRVEREEPQSNEEFYGDELRRRREAAELTQADVGERVVCSPSLIAHFEAGRRTPSLPDAQRLDKVLRTDGFFVRMRRTLGKVKFAEHFEAAAEAEQLASFIEEYAVSLMPGVLQTERYARAVLRAGQTNSTAADVDERVANRLERGRMLNNRESPTVWAILNENVIRAVVGGPEVMAEQLRHIAALGRSGRVLVQVVPHREGAHATMSSMVKLMRFDDAPDMVYVEGLLTGALTDEPSMVRRYRDAYDLARAASLPPEASLDLLDSVAEEYDHERSSHH